MYLFKTSGETLSSVVANQKHAFASMPADWSPGDLILVSKNKVDCGPKEKQIRFTMRLVDIRPLEAGEVERYWPGNEGRWKYLVICEDTRRIRQPFNLEDLIGADSKRYAPIVTFGEIQPNHAKIIEEYLRKVGTI